MQEKQLKELIVKKLAEISLLKGIELKEEHYTTWANKIINDYNSGLIKTYDDIKNGFTKLESEKSYGGLDYSIFFSGAKIDDNKLIENDWTECLYSAKHEGKYQISARAAKALNSLGGLSWLRDSFKSDVAWQKKEFINSYKNTPEPTDTNFRCSGLLAPIYLPENERKLLEN